MLLHTLLTSVPPLRAVRLAQDQRQYARIPDMLAGCPWRHPGGRCDVLPSLHFLGTMRRLSSGLPEPRERAHTGSELGYMQAI